VQNLPQGKQRAIPDVRLSFITAQDQATFERLFLSAAKGERALTGEKAKDLLVRSKLSGKTLAQIWALADTDVDGQLLFPEFALAMYFCNVKLAGQRLPLSLPDDLKKEVGGLVKSLTHGAVLAPTSGSGAKKEDSLG